MASSTKNGKVQLLDTARPNIVPKFTSLDDERMDKTKPPVPLPSASNIRELLTMSKDGKLPLDQRKDVMERIDAARDAIKTMKKSREKDLFSLDNQSLDTFALPGKPEQSAMLPTNTSKQLKKAKVTKKLKVTEVSQEDPCPAPCKIRTSLLLSRITISLLEPWEWHPAKAMTKKRRFCAYTKMIQLVLHSSVMEVEMEVDRLMIWMMRALSLTACAPVMTL